MGAAHVWEAYTDQHCRRFFWVPEVPILPSSNARRQQAATEGKLFVNSVFSGYTKANIRVVFVPTGDT